MPRELQIIGGDGLTVSVDGEREVVDPQTGEQIIIREIKKPYYGEKHFWKVFLGDLLAVMGFLDSKQIDVMCYVLAHTTPYNNQFIGVQSKIAKELGCSEPTVRRTLRKMVDANFLTKTDVKSVYQVNPSIIMQGSQTKQLGLMVTYVQQASPDVIAEAAELNVLPDTIQDESIQMTDGAEVVDNAKD